MWKVSLPAISQQLHKKEIIELDCHCFSVPNGCMDTYHEHPWKGGREKDSEEEEKGGRGEGGEGGKKGAKPRHYVPSDERTHHCLQPCQMDWKWDWWNLWCQLPTFRKYGAQRNSLNGTTSAISKIPTRRRSVGTCPSVLEGGTVNLMGPKRWNQCFPTARWNSRAEEGTIRR